jgi:hypothetical protein
MTYMDLALLDLYSIWAHLIRGVPLGPMFSSFVWIHAKWHNTMGVVGRRGPADQVCGPPVQHGESAVGQGRRNSWSPPPGHQCRCSRPQVFNYQFDLPELWIRIQWIRIRIQFAKTLKPVFWIRIRIRIRIGSGFNGCSCMRIRYQEGKNYPQK